MHTAAPLSRLPRPAGLPLSNAMHPGVALPPTSPLGPQPAAGSPIWLTVFDNCAAAIAGHDPQRGWTVTPMLQKMTEHGLYLETLANGNFVKAFFESGSITGCRDRSCAQALSQSGKLPVVGQCGGCARPYLAALAQVTAIKAALPAGATYKDCLDAVKAGWNPQQLPGLTLQQAKAVTTVCMKADPFTPGNGMAFTVASSVFPLVRNEVARFSDGYLTFNKWVLSSASVTACVHDRARACRAARVRVCACGMCVRPPCSRTPLTTMRAHVHTGTGRTPRSPPGMPPTRARRASSWAPLTTKRVLRWRGCAAAVGARRGHARPKTNGLPASKATICTAQVLAVYT